MVGDFDIVLDGPFHLDLLHGHEAAYAVVLVNHQVPGGQVREGIQLLTVGGGFFRRFSGSLPVGNELAFREDGKTAHGILHAIGQAPLRQKNLTGLGKGGQRDAEEGREAPIPQHPLQQLRPVAGAAEHQGAELHLLVMGQVGNGGVQVAAVAGQLLGRNGKQHLGGILLGIGGAAEGVKIHGHLALKLSAEVLPLADKVTQLPGHQPALEHSVQLHSHLLGAGPGGAVEGGVVAENPQSPLGDIVRRIGVLRID